MRKKTDVPLAILEVLKPYFDLKEKRIKIVDPNKSLIRFEDSDATSGFYFDIFSYKANSHNFALTIYHKPASRQNADATGVNVILKDLDKTFNMWKTMVEAYDEYTLYNDPIIKHNEEQFIQKFDILDEDADSVSFNLEQQIYLDEFLEKANNVLNNFKDGRSEADIIQIETFQAETTEIRTHLTSETKKKVIKRLSFFLAKVQKFSLPLIKEIIKELAIEGLKVLAYGR